MASVKAVYFWPMRFADIPGLEEAKSRLIHNVETGRIAHAQLFLGPEGSAKLALALAFVQYLLCEQRTSTDSCGICPTCNKVRKLIHPDVHFSYPGVDSKKLSTEYLETWREAVIEQPYFTDYDWFQRLGAENKQGNITAAECRNIIKRLSLKSFEADYRFMILWMPEYLNKEGNTLLKIIEEPPPNTIFILVAEDQEEIIGTIRSRTQLFKVPAFQDQDIAEALLELGASSREAADSMAFLSGGNMNRALKILAENETPFFDQFRSWLLMCYKRQVPDMFKWSESMAKSGRENIKHLLEFGINLLRECLLEYSGGSELMRVSGKESEFAKNFSKIAGEEGLSEMVSLLNDYTYYIERNSNPRLALFHLSLRFKNILTSSKAK